MKNQNPNIEVHRRGRESSQQLLRRFRRKIQRSGVLRTIRKKQYYQRSKSDKLKKRSALKKKEMREKYKKLRKLGELG